MVYSIDISNGTEMENPWRHFKGGFEDALLRSVNSAKEKETDKENFLPMPKKGTRKPTTRLERRKAKFAHRSEREKKRLRQAKGWDVHSWDKYPFWGEETIQERKQKEVERASLRSWEANSDWWENETDNEDSFITAKEQELEDLFCALHTIHNNKKWMDPTEWFFEMENIREEIRETLKELSYLK